MHTEFFRSKKTPNEKSIYAPFEPFYYTVNCSHITEEKSGPKEIGTEITQSS